MYSRHDDRANSDEYVVADGNRTKDVDFWHLLPEDPYAPVMSHKLDTRGDRYVISEGDEIWLRAKRAYLSAE